VQNNDKQGTFQLSSRGSFQFNGPTQLNIENLRQRGQSEQPTAITRTENEASNRVAEQASDPRTNGSQRSAHSNSKHSERYQRSLQRFRESVPKKEFKEDAEDRQARFKVPFNQAPGSTKFKSLTLQSLKALRMQQASSQASPGKGTPTQVGPSPRA